MYLFFVKSQSDLNSIMDVITNSSSFSSHANVLLYIDRGDDTWRELVGHFFKTFWKYYMCNVSIMVPDPETYVLNVSGKLFVDKHFKNKNINNRFLHGFHIQKKIVKAVTMSTFILVSVKIPK